MFPFETLQRLMRLAILLCGVATIGAVALVPGAYLVHLLNLNLSHTLRSVQALAHA